MDAAVLCVGCVCVCGQMRLSGWTGGCVDERENERERSGGSWFKIKRETFGITRPGYTL